MLGKKLFTMPIIMMFMFHCPPCLYLFLPSDLLKPVMGSLTIHRYLPKLGQEAESLSCCLCAFHPGLLSFLIISLLTKH